MKTFQEYMDYGAASLSSVALRAAADQGEVNPCVGPLSIAICLEMLARGAGEKTAASIRKLYGGSAPSVKLDRGRLDCANMIWVNPGEKAPPIRQEYKEVLKTDFDAEVDNGPASGCAGRINGWVASKTQGMIPTIIPQDPDKNDAACFLVNAVYFLCNWQTQFDPERTTDSIFAAPSGGRSVRMMSLSKSLPCVATDDGYQLVALPYEDEGLSCVFCLPPVGGDPIAAAELAGSIGDMRSQKAYVSIPRFEVESKSDMLDALLGAGAQLLYPDADFTGISAEPIEVSNVYHKAKVKCDEEGTEAAAATAIGVVRAVSVQRPFNFVADRPFGFAIVHEECDVPLFAGVVNVPEDPSPRNT